MMHGAGMYISMRDMEDLVHITHTAAGTSGEHAQVLIDGLYAPVSGSLVLGTMSGELDTVQHLKSQYRVDFRGTRTEIYDRVELTKVANIYRLFGHNVTLFDIITQEQIQPWASVNECIIEPSSISFDPCQVKKLSIGWSDMREGRAVPLPALGALAVDGYIEVTIQKPHIEPIEFRTAQKTIKCYVTSKREKKPLPIRIKSNYSYRPETFQARKTLTYKQQGFQDLRAQIPPANPEGPKIKEPVQSTVSTESVSSSARNVESNTQSVVLPEKNTESSFVGQVEMIGDEIVRRPLVFIDENGVSRTAGTTSSAFDPGVGSRRQ
jgi:hypothetical protein